MMNVACEEKQRVNKNRAQLLFQNKGLFRRYDLTQQAFVVQHTIKAHRLVIKDDKVALVKFGATQSSLAHQQSMKLLVRRASHNRNLEQRQSLIVSLNSRSSLAFLLHTQALLQLVSSRGAARHGQIRMTAFRHPAVHHLLHVELVVARFAKRLPQLRRGDALVLMTSQIDLQSREECFAAKKRPQLAQHTSTLATILEPFFFSFLLLFQTFA